MKKNKKKNPKGVRSQRSCPLGANENRFSPPPPPSPQVGPFTGKAWPAGQALPYNNFFLGGLKVKKMLEVLTK